MNKTSDKPQNSGRSQRFLCWALRTENKNTLLNQENQKTDFQKENLLSTTVCMYNKESNQYSPHFKIIQVFLDVIIAS